MTVRGISGINQVTAPAVDVHLNALPGDVHHTAPQIGLPIPRPVMGEAFHRCQVVVVIPGSIGIINAVFRKEILVVIKGQRAMILG